MLLRQDFRAYWRCRRRATNPGSSRFSVLLRYIGLTCAGSYALTYGWRYSVFVLPPEMLHEHAFTLFGRTVRLQAFVEQSSR